MCRWGFGAVGARLRLEKKYGWTSASRGGGILNEKIGIIAAPYMVVLDWEVGTK